MKKLFIIFLILISVATAHAGNMAYFNGTDSYLSFPTTEGMFDDGSTDDYRIEFDIKKVESAASLECIFGSLLNNSDSDQKIYLPLSIAGGNPTKLNSTTLMNDGNKHTVKVKRVNGRSSITVDDVEESFIENNLDNWAGDIANPVLIGAFNINAIPGLITAQNFFKGFLGNIKIYVGSTDTLAISLPLTSDFSDTSGNGITVTSSDVVIDDDVAHTHETVTMSNTNQDGQWLTQSGTELFFTDFTPVVGLDYFLAGKNSSKGPVAQLNFCLYFPINIPAGATITSAILQGTTLNLSGVVTASTKIFAEKTATPGVWSDLANYQSRHGNLTTAYADWTGGTWTQATYVDTPELKTVVQEVIDASPSGVTGLSFFIDDNASGNTEAFIFAGVGWNGGTNPFKLVITYTSGSAAKKQQIMMMW